MSRLACSAIVAVAVAVGAALASAACATLGSTGGGDTDLPSSGVGPFRKLTPDEMLGVAPYVLDDRQLQYREPAALPLADAADGEVALYVTGGPAGKGSIFRSRAADGRSFYGAPLDSGHAPVKVLAPDAPWEGGGIGSPSAVAADAGAVWLYYGTASGSVGLARSTDGGLTFVKDTVPLLDGARSPSVARLPSGRFLMLFVDASGVVEEADSDDGAHFTRAGAVLGVSMDVPDASLAPGEKPPFDTARIDHPAAFPRVTPGGRVQIRVLYTGYDHTGASALGFAARYGEGFAPLVKNPTPVLSIASHEARPALFDWPSASPRSTLYFELDKTAEDNSVHRAVGVALAPANETLSFPGGGYADHP